MTADARPGCRPRPGVVAPATAASKGGGPGQRRRRRLLGLIPPLLLLVGWQLAWSFELRPRSLLPSPHEVLTAADKLFFGHHVDTLAGVVPFAGAGWSHVSASLGRCGTSWAAAVVIGLVIGLGLGLSRWVADLFEPLSNGLRAVPLYAWLPLAIVQLGVGEKPARVLIFIGALWPVVVATTDGVARVPRAHIETARMLGTPRRRLWRRVYLPSALPEIVTGLRLSLILAWTCVIVGELVGMSTGSGAMMNAAREIGATDQIIVGIVVFAVIGYAADRILRLAARPFIRWSET